MAHFTKGTLSLPAFDNASREINLIAPTGMSASVTYTMPGSYGLPSQFLQTDGAGRLNFGISAATLLGSVSGVNPRATGNTNIFTIPTGRKAIITEGIYILDSASGLTGIAKCGFGADGGDDNIFAASNLTGFTATGLYYAQQNVDGSSYIAVGGDQAHIHVRTAFTGGTASMSVYLFGFYL